jgi:PKHD-type hydroxylase
VSGASLASFVPRAAGKYLSFFNWLNNVRERPAGLSAVLAGTCLPPLPALPCAATKLAVTALSRRPILPPMQPEQFSPTSPFAFWEGAFTPAELDRIEALGEAMAPAKATLFGGTETDEYADIRVTQTAWIPPSLETKWLYDRMQGAVRTINDQVWQFDLRGFSEHFQYAVYHGNEGGHFDWHVDQGDLTQSRKLSLSLQLSDPSEYDGCELQLQGGRRTEIAPKQRGALIAFPSYVLHRVTPITRGTRKALVVWTTGPRFR